uniref:hypothetical protein n=1 Tax=Pseudovibrio sp. WM33 TaxID=1735585 RepID=UPI0019D384ED
TNFQSGPLKWGCSKSRQTQPRAVWRMESAQEPPIHKIMPAFLIRWLAMVVHNAFQVIAEKMTHSA